MNSFLTVAGIGIAIGGLILGAIMIEHGVSEPVAWTIGLAPGVILAVIAYIYAIGVCADKMQTEMNWPGWAAWSLSPLIVIGYAIAMLFVLLIVVAAFQGLLHAIRGRKE